MSKINQFLKFKPILKEKIWGGEKLMKQFNKVSDKSNIGESWEISGYKDDISIVTNGDLKGKTLEALVEEYQSLLLGKRVFENFGNKFPLLIKFIDAKETLSLQVHPNDIIAQKRHNSLGKTEMWYVLESEKNGHITIGFSEETDKKTFEKALKEGTEKDLLNTDYVKKGDTYLIPAGLIHAIGKGVLLAEIQETSDITYRISDWNRTDAKGLTRETHVDLALDIIEYSAKSNYKSEYFKRKNNPTNIVDCNYFTTNFIQLTGQFEIDHTNKDSFVIYICVDGKVEFTSERSTEVIRKGETLLVPACIKKIKLKPFKKSELLEVFIK